MARPKYNYIVKKHSTIGKSEELPEIIGIRMINGPALPYATAPKFWNIMAGADDDEGVITLYGDVMSKRPTDWWTGEPEPGLFITPEGFMEDLEAVKGKSRITVKINSCGGDLYTGIAIHNAIKSLSATTTVVVDGIAASAASVIMCAGDTVKVWPGSIVMIHGVSVGLCDYYTSSDLKQIIKGNDAAEKAIAAIYEGKTGTDAETLRSMIAKETWMTGAEAIDKGFADELLDGEGPEASLMGKEILMVAGVKHDIKGFHIPDCLNIKRVSPAAAAPVTSTAGTDNEPAKVGQTNEGGRTSMKTIGELRTAHPDLVKELEDAAAAPAVSAAITAERERLRAIEEIAPSVGDTQLVEDAKYGEKPCNAAELALKAMQKSAKLGTKHLTDSAEDNKDSGAAGVQGDPKGVDGENDDAKEAANMANLYNTIKGGKK